MTMPVRNSLLLGQIALELKLITPEKLKQCLDLQAGQVNPRPIGALLVEEGFLTPEALATAVEEQSRRLADTAPFASAPKAAVSFGRLLVQGGHATQEHVNEALRAQQDLAERGDRKRLGEILVESGRIPFETVPAILKQQGKVLMSCTFCGTHLNVIQAIAQGYPCRRCGMPLEEKAVSVSAEDTAYLLPPVDPRIASRAPAGAPVPAPSP
ncbi:MAG TPA: hypothetical protein VEN81_12460, partial [Planctomycetota bacterium]|nr:hypothetical protein [Planctomycetota bacterium]